MVARRKSCQPIKIKSTPSKGPFKIIILTIPSAWDPKSARVSNQKLLILEEPTKKQVVILRTHGHELIRRTISSMIWSSRKQPARSLPNSSHNSSTGANKTNLLNNKFLISQRLLISTRIARHKSTLLVPHSTLILLSPSRMLPWNPLLQLPSTSPRSPKSLLLNQPNKKIYSVYRTRLKRKLPASTTFSEGHLELCHSRIQVAI